MKSMLRKEAIEDIFGKTQPEKLATLSYLNEQEIYVLTMMQTVCESSKLCNLILSPIIKNHLQFKKSLKGLGIATYQNIINPYRYYQPQPSLEKSRLLEQNETEEQPKKKRFKLL